MLHARNKVCHQQTDWVPTKVEIALVSLFDINWHSGGLGWQYHLGV
jgi:hypothetical protein